MVKESNLSGDTSRAFDKVWHKSFMTSYIMRYGLSKKDSGLNFSYLLGRSHWMVFHVNFFKWVEVLNGVPQRSITGPFLFLVYTNDIIKHNGVYVCIFFADDTSLYFIVSILSEQQCVVFSPCFAVQY